MVFWAGVGPIEGVFDRFSERPEFQPRIKRFGAIEGVKTSHVSGRCWNPQGQFHPRADFIFEVEEAILVTQWFHLDRALYICDRLGLDAVGVAADRRDYYSARYWWWREVAAVTRAWLDLNVLHPTPVLVEKLPVH